MEQNAKSVPSVVSGDEKDLSKSLQVLSFREHKISSMSKNGERYYNATEMAKAYGEKPIHFLRNPNTLRFVEALSISIVEAKNIEVRKSHLNINDTTNVFFATKSGEIDVVGGGATWMHEKLALKFAAWLDVDFELWMLDTMWKLMRGELKTPSRRLIDAAIYTQATKVKINDTDFYSVAELRKLHGLNKCKDYRRLARYYGNSVANYNGGVYVTKSGFEVMAVRSEIAQQMYDTRSKTMQLRSAQTSLFTSKNA
jgi:hypothetical protein